MFGTMARRLTAASTRFGLSPSLSSMSVERHTWSNEQGAAANPDFGFGFCHASQVFEPPVGRVSELVVRRRSAPVAFLVPLICCKSVCGLCCEVIAAGDE